MSRPRLAFSASFSLLFAVSAVACGGGSSHSGGSSAAQESQDSGAPPPAFVLDEGTVTLAAGQEGLFCNQMAVPAEFATPDYFVTGIDADVSLGTHHLVVLASDDPVGSTAPLCKDTGAQPTTGGGRFQDLALDGNLAQPVIDSLKRVAFGGGGGAAQIRFPEGYGKAMPLGFFETSHHVINPGADPLEIHGRFGVHVAKAEDISHPMGSFFANALDVSVPAGSEGTTEGTMIAPEAMDVVALTAHSHNFTIRFEMFPYRNGAAETNAVYLSESYESPPVTVFDPPLHLEAGEGITFRCTYRNDTAKALGWGVDGGEMCMPMGMYARPDGASGVPPTMSVLMNGVAPAPLAPGTAGFFG
ncbi:MAG TPA: hypothetical protein VHE30_21415 [Polyangiaceae bacterium]|nr:hypothetical protein [Polyangiaceae bacterium]